MPRRSGLDRFLVGVYAAGLTLAAAYALAACNGWDPRKPFERNAPAVDEAIQDLDAGQFASAEEALENYLKTGACSDAGIGISDAVRQLPNGSFDLGLTLFHLAEKFGQRFGDEELDDAGKKEASPERNLEVNCALAIVLAIANDVHVPAELRARAFYLAGNLEFLRRKYKEAIKLYDESLRIVPGLPEDAGDAIGRDAAHNRAIALRRIDELADAGNDGGEDGSDGESDQDGSDGGDGSGESDAGDAANGTQDGASDGGDDDQNGQQSGGPDGGKDAGKDAGADASDDGKNDAGEKPNDKKDQKAPDPQPKGQQKAPDEDYRMLERLGEAPSYQQEQAKQRANERRGRRMEDK